MGKLTVGSVSFHDLPHHLVIPAGVTSISPQGSFWSDSGYQKSGPNRMGTRASDFLASSCPIRP